jgi:hypothetical protein
MQEQIIIPPVQPQIVYYHVPPILPVAPSTYTAHEYITETLDINAQEENTPPHYTVPYACVQQSLQYIVIKHLCGQCYIVLKDQFHVVQLIHTYHWKFVAGEIINTQK